MKVELHKKISKILILTLLSNVTVFANPIAYKYEDKKYDYKSVYVIKDKATGETIPLSIGPVYDDCSYAYLPDGGEIALEIVKPYNFTDCEEYQSHYITEMYAKGVLIGYPDGTFRPNNTLTRAEMATIFCRMFNVKPLTIQPCFNDVTSADWYYGNVMALVEIGVLKEDTLFNPNALVSQEQFVAMLYRMLDNMGYVNEKAEFDFNRYVDINSVSSYAKDAYAYLFANNYAGYYTVGAEIIENDYLDMADDEYRLNPGAPVSRSDCAARLDEFTTSFIRKNAPAVKKKTAPDVEIPVLDGSTSTYKITENIYFLYYNNSKNHPKMPLSHSKTSNSYKRRIDGEVEMIFVPDPGEEIKEYAEKKGVKLKYIPIAGEALVFFTGKDNPVEEVTTEQLRNIYIGNSISNWKEIGNIDAALAAFCRNEDSGSHTQIDKFILNGENIHPDIKRERTSIMMSSIFTDLSDFENANQGSYGIGYSLYYYYYHNALFDPNRYKLLTVDGVKPSDKSIADEIYPYTTRYYAVIRDENNPKVEEFAELMQGEFGQQVVSRSGYGTLEYPAAMPID